MKKKICIITSSYPKFSNDSRNAGVFVKDFALLLSQENYEVYVLTPSGNYSDFTEENFKVHFFPWINDELGLSSLNPKNPIHLFKLASVVISGIFTTRNFVKKNNIDICIAMWAIPSGFYALVSKIFLKIPYFVWALGSDIWKANEYPLGNFILNKVLKNAQILFADGIKLSKNVETISKKKCHFVASNRILDQTIREIEYEKFDSTKINFIFIGRFHSNKGVDLLIEAISQLNEADKKRTLFHIFGGGPLEKQLKRMVKDLKLDSNTFVNGFLEGDMVFSYMSKADFVIIPSRIESIPVILSDALQSNKPVIVTNVGDMGDLVKEHNVGFVAEQNSLSLAKVIHFAIESNQDKINSFEQGRHSLKDYLDLNKSIEIFKKFL